MWYGDFLDFTVSEKENDVSNEVEKQVPGVPDGYRLVAIRQALRGETYLSPVNGALSTWEYSRESSDHKAIVEPIEPPKPKTEEIVLNKYLVDDGKNQRFMIIATAEYMDTSYIDYKLIGHSETIEVEVRV